MMKWFYKMTVATKIIFSSVVFLMFTLILGTISIKSLSNVNTNSENMYNNNFIPIQQLTTVQSNFHIVRGMMLEAIYEKNLSTTKAKMHEIEELANSNNDQLGKYKETIATEEEQLLYDNLLKEIEVYRDVRGKTLQLTQDGKYDEALIMLNNKLSESRIDTDEALNILIQYNNKVADVTLVDNKNNFKRNNFLVIVLIIVGSTISIGVGLIIAKTISNQLNELLSIAGKITEGDLSVDVNIKSKDEIGILGNAFNKMANNINYIITNIYVSSQQVSSGAKNISNSSIELSEGAKEQAASIQELTSALEEISSQTNMNANSANQANELTDIVKGNAVDGDNQMKEMLRAMEEINIASDNIHKIIKVIDEIAFQTNILALNAAVEAARVGQHGKGFAVVAEEVRNLAARSANAAKETTIMIEGSIKKVEDGTKIANSTAVALDKIVSGIENVSNIVRDISLASTEQAAAIEQINHGIMQVSQIVQLNTEASEGSAAASEELSSQAELLKELVGNFKLKENNSVVTPVINTNFNSALTLKRADKFNSAHNTLSDGDFGKY